MILIHSSQILYNTVVSAKCEKCVAALTRRTAEEEIGPQDQRAGKIHVLGGLSLSLEAVDSPSIPACASFRWTTHEVIQLNHKDISTWYVPISACKDMSFYKDDRSDEWLKKVGKYICLRIKWHLFWSSVNTL